MYIRPARLARPAELRAALESSSGGSTATVHLTAWAELQFLHATFDFPGACQLPPLAFHTITVPSEPSSFSIDLGPGSRGSARRLSGTTAVLPASVEARYVWLAPYEVRIGCVDPGVLIRAAAETGLPVPDRLAFARVPSQPDPSLLRLLQVLEAEAALGAHAVQGLIIQQLASAIACRLLLLLNGPASQVPGHPGALGGPAFARVRAFVEENLDQDISLEDLARVAGVSRFHFARQFRSRTGESPMRYVLRTRVERAKILLRERGSTVSEIAVELGFADQSHFTRTFRQLVGVPPGAYARHHRAAGCA